MLRLKLKQCLRENQLTEAMLADAIAELNTGLKHPISERYLRYLAQNALPLTPINLKRKPSLIILGVILRALKNLTSEEIRLENILEYVNDPIHLASSDSTHKNVDIRNVSGK